ncbi:MAG TPA: hypothetical protein VFV97_04390 [Rhodanobacteraceae bacterium]|nr:hypothetical protein [Rhodanobacteraceae bacterium]
MSARRAFGCVAALALVAGVALWYSHRATRSHRATPPAQTASNPSRSVTPAPRPAPPGDAMIAHDPDAAAQLWHARAASVLMAKHRKDFGDDVARLMDLPWDEAWDPLVAAAKDGNAGAAVAVITMSTTCNVESENARLRHGTPRPASTYYPGLPDAWKPFVDRLDALQKQDHDRVAHCEGVGDAFDLALMFLDQFFSGSHPEAEVEMLADNKDPRQAIADLRELLAAHDVPRGRYLLGDLLLKSDDAAERAEGRAMIEQLAPDDPEAATRLGDCLQQGCAGAAPDPAAARQWLESAAGAGDLLALSQLDKALDAEGDRAAAWAWSRYALDLALDGCFEWSRPSYVNVANAARTEATKRADLTPAEQNAGLAIGYAIAGRWEKTAREQLSCD